MEQKIERAIDEGLESISSGLYIVSIGAGIVLIAAGAVLLLNSGRANKKKANIGIAGLVLGLAATISGIVQL